MGLPRLPNASILPLHVAGAAAGAAGCFAYSLVGVADPVARRHALAWFASGHAAALTVAIIEILTTLGRLGLAGRWLSPY